MTWSLKNNSQKTCDFYCSAETRITEQNLYQLAEKIQNYLIVTIVFWKISQHL